MLINKLETTQRKAAQLLANRCAEEEPLSQSMQGRNWFFLHLQTEDRKKRKKKLSAIHVKW